MDRDMVWRWDQVLKVHPNGMRFSVFGEDGDLLATNEYFSVGGGFVVNEKTKVDENLFYKGVDKSVVHGARLHQSSHTDSDSMEATSTANSNQPPYPFVSGDSLLTLTKKHNLLRIWSVMDDCIRTGVSSAEEKLPGRLGLRRRAPLLYRRLMRGFYPGLTTPTFAAIDKGPFSAGDIAAPEEFRVLQSANAESEGGQESSGRSASGQGAGRKIAASRPMRVVGVLDHPVTPVPPRKTMIPAMDFLSCYAIAVNEVNASGGRIVTSPTNGAAGVIPAVLKYIVEAVGMLFKRGSTISAAEGGCQAEVGAVKAITAAQLAMASQNVYSVTLDEAIEAMRLTAADMSVKYKETSLSGLARTVRIPLTVPEC
uniref:Uncharacterized protein n=1 Tax=Ganoderma boninense TaxID=34458 RepID=A0A5K1JSM1_9APHY|nr:Uncharacterized protein [Ganoderma boninense]